jgi:hypothetical protein
VLGIASVPLLKLGRGTKQRTIAWHKFVAKEFPNIA